MESIFFCLSIYNTIPLNNGSVEDVSTSLAVIVLTLEKPDMVCGSVYLSHCSGTHFCPFISLITMLLPVIFLELTPPLKFTLPLITWKKILRNHIKITTL